MTRTTNARLAGATFLVYIVAGIASMTLFGRATEGADAAERLSALGAHPTALGVVILLSLFMCLCALVLAVTLHALTRDEDSDLALLGMVCRVAEGVVGAAGMTAPVALQWLATARSAGTVEHVAAHTLAAYLFRDYMPLSATFFAVGSTLFSYLLLRGRLIPVPLAWLGVIASVLLAVALPLQLAGFLDDQFVLVLWVLMLAFEVPLGLWLLTRGTSASRAALQGASRRG